MSAYPRSWRLCSRHAFPLKPGISKKATYHYGKLVELWKDADPELQPRVEAARRTVSALSRDR